MKLETSYDFSYWTYALGKAENSLNHRADSAVEGHPTRRLTLQGRGRVLARRGSGLPLAHRRRGAADRHLRQRRRCAHRREHRAPLCSRRLGYTYHWARFDQYNAMQAADVPAAVRRHRARRAGRSPRSRSRAATTCASPAARSCSPAGPQAIDANRWDIGATYSPTVGWRHQFLPRAGSDGATPAAPSISRSAIRQHRRRNGALGRADVGLDLARLGAAPLQHADVACSAGYVHDLLGATGAGTALWADAVYAQAGYHYLEKFDAHVGLGYFRNGAAVNQPLGVRRRHRRYVRRLARRRLLPRRRVLHAALARRPGLASSAAGQFPNVTRNIVGIRLLAVLGADARPPRREVKQ